MTERCKREGKALVIIIIIIIIITITIIKRSQACYHDHCNNTGLRITFLTFVPDKLKVNKKFAKKK